MTQQHVILPNPGYKIEANIWHLDIKASALRAGPIASFLRNCNTTDSPPIPTSEVVLSQQMTLLISAMKLPWRTFENFKGMQRGFQLEATCVRLWATGIQDQIMDETEKVQNWITRMIGEPNLLRRVQPAWIHQLQAQSNQQPPVSMTSSSSSPPVQGSVSSASNVPAKAATTLKNPSMASAPRNAAFPKVQGADPWADLSMSGIDDAIAAARAIQKRNSSSSVTHKL